MSARVGCSLKRASVNPSSRSPRFLRLGWTNAIEQCFECRLIKLDIRSPIRQCIELSEQPVVQPFVQHAETGAVREHHLSRLTSFPEEREQRPVSWLSPKLLPHNARKPMVGRARPSTRASWVRPPSQNPPCGFPATGSPEPAHRVCTSYRGVKQYGTGEFEPRMPLKLAPMHTTSLTASP